MFFLRVPYVVLAFFVGPPLEEIIIQNQPEISETVPEHSHFFLRRKFIFGNHISEYALKYQYLHETISFTSYLPIAT
jgi:hypothetical protein